MTSLGNESVRAPIDKLKQRAYSIQSRMAELGHKIPLTHAYEAMAKSSGYRDWPTMRAMADLSTESMVIGHEAEYVSADDGGYSKPRKVKANERKPIKIPGASRIDHFEICGPSGPDRTRMIAGFGSTAMENGEGFIWLDASGDMSLHHRLAMLAERHGRRNDVRVMNLMSSVPDSIHYNPFAHCSADDLADLVIHMNEEIDPERRWLDTDVWLGRTRLFLLAVFHVAVWLREEKGIPSDPASLLAQVPFEKLVTLHQDTEDRSIPDTVREATSAYLRSLPAYKADFPPNMQPATTSQHHGYFEMRLERQLGLLSGTFGHIFNHPGREVVSLDSVLSTGKILLVLLPHPEDRSFRDVDGTFHLIYQDLMRALKSQERSNPFTVLASNVENYLPWHFDETLGDASSGMASLVFGWEKPPLAAGLKKATSIHMSDKGDGHATVVTRTSTYDAVMKRADI